MIAYLFWFHDMDVSVSCGNATANSVAFSSVEPQRCSAIICFQLCFLTPLWCSFLFFGLVLQLPAAYHMVTSKRPCGPKKDAIRGATYDLAKNDPWKAPFEQLPDFAFSGVADWERRLIHERVRSCNFH